MIKEFLVLVDKGMDMQLYKQITFLWHKAQEDIATIRVIYIYCYHTICHSSGWDSEGGYEPAPPVPEKRFDLEEESTVGAAGQSDTGGGGGGGSLMTTSVTSGTSSSGKGGGGPSSPRSPHLHTRTPSGTAPSPTSPGKVLLPC